MVKIGIIGGSGLDDPDILEDSNIKEVETPYGKAILNVGKIKGVDVVLLARHGKEHTNLLLTDTGYLRLLVAVHDNRRTELDMGRLRPRVGAQTARRRKRRGGHAEQHRPRPRRRRRNEELHQLHTRQQDTLHLVDDDRAT